MCEHPVYLFRDRPYLRGSRCKACDLDNNDGVVSPRLSNSPFDPGNHDAYRQWRAAKLRDIYGFAFDVAVDDIDGSLHRAMSPKPNSAYVLGADGTILFRAQWANDTPALAAALEAVAAGRPLRPSESGGIVKPILRMLRNVAPVLDRAGRGAWADMWLVAAPLAMIAFALKVLGVGPLRA